MSRTYEVDMLDAESGAQNRYEFDADDNMMNWSPMKVVRRFMEHVDRTILVREHVDYEVYSALKNRKHNVVTAMGCLILDQDELPFLMMISPKREKTAASR